MVDYIHVCVFHSRKTGFKKWLDTSSIPCYLSSFCSIFWCVDPRYLLDTSAIDEYFLDTSSTDISIPVDTYIYQDLLAFLYKAPTQFGSHFHRSLSRYFSVSLPKTLQSHSYFGSQGFCKVFQVFSSLGKLLILLIYAFHILKPRIWGFSKLMRFHWNFGLGFHLNVFKTSYITSH